MDDLRVTGAIVIPEHELKWRFDPSGGPGGQHANKSSTRVELSFDVAQSSALSAQLKSRMLSQLGAKAGDGVVTINVGESRSQWRNRQIARRKLSELLAEAAKPPPPQRRQTRPTRAARERRLADKRARSATKRLRRRPPEID